MGKRYIAHDARIGTVRYQDRKRRWWLLSVVYPLLPFADMAAHAHTGREIALGLPLLISYGLMPLLDALIGVNVDPRRRRTLYDRYGQGAKLATPAGLAEPVPPPA